ncbi:MAG TPA: C45 family peptidase [Egibacteraceae bacterium]|nr:C45 family peptidase [Egibacteraceae bacterium]
MSGFPHLRLTGDHRDRGRAYGEQAADRVAASITAYRQVFAHLAGWDWDRVVAEALRYEPAIADFAAEYLAEMRGLAEGAGVAYEDVLAINTRTEVMFSAKARKAAATFGRGECSAFAILPPRSVDGHTLVGQNWDWLAHCFDTVVVLEVEQDDAPDYVTVVEAGLLAKSGMNAAGVGVTTNALVTTDDAGEPAVPYHVVLRGLMDARNLSEALSTIQRAPRSSSANYLLASRDGLAIDVEAAPGDFSRLYFLDPVDGVLLHTNHFVSPRFDRVDVSTWAMPDSPIRLQRLRALLADHDGLIGVDVLSDWLADHANHPAGVCCHPDTALPEVEQDATVVSVVMDLDAGRLWIADGHPCDTPYRTVDLHDVFGGRGVTAAAG